MKHLKNIFQITILAIVILFSACKKSNTPDEIAPVVPVVPVVPLAAQSTSDVAYGSDPLQKFDMVLPAGRTTATTKVLIIIHGGSWSAGDKTEMTQVITSLKTSLPDYAYFNLNYRLATTNGITGTNLFPTQENDVKAAVDFINSKRAEYKISDKIAILGASAGAHLALLQAYKNATPKIKAVVDLYGPTDMVDMYNNPATSVSSPFTVSLFGLLVSNTTGGNPTSSPAAFSSSSPVNYVSSQSAPTIIFHGTTDAVVKLQQSTLLQAKLIQNNVINQYVPYAGQGHAYVDSLPNTLVRTVAFLNANVQ
jgi:acetyl esterase/lipase